MKGLKLATLFVLVSCSGSEPVDPPDGGTPCLGTVDGCLVDAGSNDGSLNSDGAVGTDADLPVDPDATPPPGFPGRYEVTLCEAPCLEGVGYICGDLGCCNGFTSAQAMDVLTAFEIPADLPNNIQGESGSNWAAGYSPTAHALAPWNNELRFDLGFRWYQGFTKAMDPIDFEQLSNGDLVATSPVVVFGRSGATRVCEMVFPEPRFTWIP